MDERIKQAWVAALRSGEYKQGFGELRPSVGRFCANGVLCELYRKEMQASERVLVQWIMYGDEGFTLQIDIAEKNYRKCAGGFLPNLIAEWSGITYDQEVIVRSLNDSGKKDFLEIAARIEESF